MLIIIIVTDGYGFCTVPTVPGIHEMKCVTWKPTGSLRQQFSCMYVHVLMRDEKEGRKKQARSNKQQHSTPKAVTFPKNNELPRVGLKPHMYNNVTQYNYVERGKKFSNSTLTFENSYV